MEKPTKALWVYNKQVFRSLKGTTDLGIQYSGNHDERCQVVGFSDSDWAGCKVDKKSTTGFTFILQGGAVF